MMDLTKLFADFFDDEKHSDEEILRYTTQHLALMNGNNPANVLDARIASTQTAFSAFAACKGDKAFRAAARESANESKRLFRDGLRGPVGRCAAAVEVAFGKGTPDFIACFPNGRDGVAGATEDMLLPRLTGLHSALSARSATAGISAQVTSVGGLMTTWTSLLAAADAADGTESGTDAQKKVCWKALTRELSRNALFLAFTYLEDFDKAALLLPQHLLRNRQSGPEIPSAPGLVSNYAGGMSVPLVVTPVGGEVVEEIIVFRRLLGEGDWTEVSRAPSDGSAKEFSIDLPAPGTYEFVAKAGNESGESEPSAVVTAAAT